MLPEILSNLSDAQATGIIMQFLSIIGYTSVGAAALNFVFRRREKVSFALKVMLDVVNALSLNGSSHKTTD